MRTRPPSLRLPGHWVTLTCVWCTCTSILEGLWWPLATWFPRYLRGASRPWRRSSRSCARSLLPLGFPPRSACLLRRLWLRHGSRSTLPRGQPFPRWLLPSCILCTCVSFDALLAGRLITELSVTTLLIKRFWGNFGPPTSSRSSCASGSATTPASCEEPQGLS